MTSQNSSDTPAFSKLRRVVDMTEINQKNRPKTQNTKGKKQPPHKPEHDDNGAAKKNSQQPSKKQNPCSDTRLAAHKYKRDGQHYRAMERENVTVKQESLAPSAVDTVSEPVADSRNEISHHDAGIEPIHPETPAACLTQEQACENANRPLNVNRKNVMRFAEKRPIAKKNAIKVPKQLAKQIKSDAASNTAFIRDKMNGALMLQSWHAKLWSECIAEHIPALATQLPKCMPLVQARFVNDFCVSCGRIEATVVDQLVSISLRQFTQGQWKSVINLLSDKAIFTTSLLNGELPEGIVEIFKQASLSLFPTKGKEFSFACDCGANTPCEHICALLLAFASALEEDPFHILTLRGMDREMLLSQLRDARSDQVVDEKNRHHINYEISVQSVDFNSYFLPKAPLEELSFHIQFTPNSLIRRLGNPSTWQSQYALSDVVMPIIESAARQADNLGHFVPQAEDMPTDEVKLFTPQNRNPGQNISRSPKNSVHSPKFAMPDLAFVQNALAPEILESLTDNPVSTAEDIIRWLKTRGASDIRTLARRTRLHKPTIEAFLNVFCEAGLAIRIGEEDKLKFQVTF